MFKNAFLKVCLIVFCFLLSGTGHHELKGQNQELLDSLVNKNNWDQVFKEIQNEIDKGNSLQVKQDIERVKTLNGNKLTKDIAIRLDIFTGVIFNYLSQKDSLAFYYEKVQNQIDKKSKYWHHYLILKALYKSKIEAHDEAIELLLECLNFFSSQKDFYNQGFVYNLLGHEYSIINQQENALFFFKKSIEIEFQSNSTLINVLRLNNIGTSYNKMGYLDSALISYEKAYNLMIVVPSKGLIAQNFNNRANVLEKQGKYEEAEKLFLKTYEISIENEIKIGTVLSLINLGNLKRLQKDFPHSIEFLNLAEKKAIENSYQRELALIYERKAKTFKDWGKFKEAFENEVMFKDLNDSIFNQKLQLQAQELKERYQADEKDKQIFRLSQTQNRNKFLAVALGFALIISGFVIHYFKIKAELVKSRNQQLIKENKSIEQELHVQVMQMVGFQNQLIETENKIVKLVKSAQGKINPETIKSVFEKEKDLLKNKEYEVKLAKTNELFFKKLLEINPDLSPTELKVCAYLRANLVSKEIAEITHKNVRTVENLRTSIRTKLNLNPSENLTTFLISMNLE
jgi:tetratricopeptide (TPR) repeat protein